VAQSLVGLSMWSLLGVWGCSLKCINTLNSPLQTCHEVPTVLRNIGQYLKHDDTMCSVSQLLLYLLTRWQEEKLHYQFSFSSWTACFGTLSVGRSLYGKHVSVERQLRINTFKFEFGNLYAVPEL